MLSKISDLQTKIDINNQDCHNNIINNQMAIDKRLTDIEKQIIDFNKPLPALNSDSKNPYQYTYVENESCQKIAYDKVVDVLKPDEYILRKVIEYTKFANSCYVRDTKYINIFITNFGCIITAVMSKYPTSYPHIKTIRHSETIYNTPKYEMTVSRSDLNNKKQLDIIIVKLLTDSTEWNTNVLIRNLSFTEHSTYNNANTIGTIGLITNYITEKIEYMKIFRLNNPIT